MFASRLLFLRRRRQRFALALCLDFDVAHPGFQVEQLELRIAELLAAGSVFLDPLQTQPLFQYLDLQLGPRASSFCNSTICSASDSGMGEGIVTSGNN